MSDPAKKNAKEQWGDLNKELEAFIKLAGSPRDRKDWDYAKWLKLKARLIDLKYGGLKDIPGPYGKKLIEWYAPLHELDMFIEEIEDEFRNSDKLGQSQWDTIVDYAEAARKAKERVEKFVE